MPSKSVKAWLNECKFVGMRVGVVWRWNKIHNNETTRIRLNEFRRAIESKIRNSFRNCYLSIYTLCYLSLLHHKIWHNLWCRIEISLEFIPEMKLFSESVNFPNAKGINLPISSCAFPMFSPRLEIIFSSLACSFYLKWWKNRKINNSRKIASYICKFYVQTFLC